MLVESILFFLGVLCLVMLILSVQDGRLGLGLSFLFVGLVSVAIAAFHHDSRMPPCHAIAEVRATPVVVTAPTYERCEGMNQVCQPTRDW